MANTKIPVELSSTPGIVDNSNATAITIDSAGRVAIGTSSILTDTRFALHEGNVDLEFSLDNAVANTARIFAFDRGTTTHKNLQLRANQTEFYSGSSEAMRIDSSGNLLVGKTSTSQTVEGIVLQGADGRLNASADGNVAGIFNRLTNDGDIFLFRKDGSTVGSIGTTGSNVVIGTGSVGLRFYDGGDAVIPHTAAGGSSNGLVDLGQGGFNAFKDLHLSGGAYLGGTAAANKLDDYEEGTWTPTFSGATLSTATGSYTKIGNQVTVHFRVITTGGLPSSGGQVQVGNLPFTIASGFGGVGGLYVGPSNVSSATGGGGTIVPYVTGGESFIRFLNVDTGTFGYTLWGELEVSANNVVTAIGTVTYQV